MAAVAPVCAEALTISDSEEEAVTAVSAPFVPVSPCTALARFDKSPLMPLRSVACVCKLVTSPCQAVNCPLCASCISDTTAFTSIPFPFNRLAVLKLIPMSFLSFAYGCGGASAGAQFRRFLKFLRDSTLHAKFLVAGHLQDHVVGLVQILNDYLVLNLRILMHFDNILSQLVSGGDIFRRGDFLFWQSSRNGLGRSGTAA